MPRSRGGRSAPARAPSAPSRPTVPAPQPRTAGPTPPQQRPMSTTAAAPAQTQANPAAQGPGLFGQMASTAAGVAVGSSIGHAIGGFFGGGGSSSAAPEAAPAAQDQYQQPAQNAYAQPMDSGLYNAQGGYGSTAQQQQQAGPCAENVKSFTRCMDENQGNMTVCSWYLDQLKACQAAARPY